MTTGQINTPSPAAITKCAARNVYKRKSETSTEWQVMLTHGMERATQQQSSW